LAILQREPAPLSTTQEHFGELFETYAFLLRNKRKNDGAVAVGITDSSKVLNHLIRQVNTYNVIYFTQNLHFKYK
jgi:hypothetical protein